MSRKQSFPADRRAVSVTITHVLTIGITTILISGLLIGTGTLLDSQKDRATYDEKSTIGDRLATEITAVSHSAAESSEDDVIEVRTEHPRQLSGGQYFIKIIDGDSCVWDGDYCLELRSGQTEDVQVPFSLGENAPEAATGDDTRVQGGEIWIHYDNNDQITLSQERPES